jgi:pimeloyl-ACP methyl ester carboxylesterase
LRAYVDHGFVDQPDGTVTLACRPEDEADTYGGAGASRVFERLGELRLPVTIARGSTDNPGPGATARDQIEQLADGRLVDLPGLGHFGPLQDEPLVARSVIDALLP